MKLRELIEQLEEIEKNLQAGLGDEVEAEVVCAIQPNYPLAVSVDSVCVLDDEDSDEPQLIAGLPIVWIATSNHPPGLNPYAPRAVWEAIP